MSSQVEVEKKAKVGLRKQNFKLLYLALYVCKLMEVSEWRVSWVGNATVFVGVYTSIKTESTPTVKKLEVQTDGLSCDFLSFSLQGVFTVCRV